jgi:hypothetical protein
VKTIFSSIFPARDNGASFLPYRDSEMGVNAFVKFSRGMSKFMFYLSCIPGPFSSLDLSLEDGDPIDLGITW